MPNNSTSHTDFWAMQLRSGIVTLLIAALTGFATSWWRTQRDQDLCLYRLDAIEKKVNDLANQMAQNAQLQQQNAVTDAQQELMIKNLTEQMAEKRK